jgi:phosphoesterase RecJ-like protein
LEEFKQFADHLGERILIVGHQNADPDALGAAQGVKELILKLNPSIIAEIVLPEDTSLITLNVASSLGLEIKAIETMPNPDTIVIVDTGGTNQLGGWWQRISKENVQIIFIDHHLPDSEILQLSNLYIIDPDATSTSEMVYQLMKTYNLTPSKKTASALLAGITFDTRHFSIGGTNTFSVASELLEVTGDISEVKELLILPMGESEKIARLKAGQRADITQIGEWLISTSQLSSFQSSGARALVSLGADLAVVAGEVDNEVRASMRSTSQFYRSTLLHLGDFCYELAKFFNGSGSGHPTAAGLKCSVDLDSFIEETKKQLEEELSQRT